jgi:hypothetical protein
MREIPCSSAVEFISYLRITHDLWGGQPNWDWGFRGQGDAKWPLLPSAFRTGTVLSFADETLKAPLGDDEAQIRQEWKLIQHFLFVADRVGLSVPGDAQHFRLPPPAHEQPRWQRADWPSDDLLDTLAIAQHHGVPTRLLDITHNSLIAAFFAADDARDKAKVKDATHFGVWAVDLSMLRQAAALGMGRLLHVTAPRAANSFLHHQDGLFLIDTMANSRRAKLGRFETIDEAVEETFRCIEQRVASNDAIRYYRRCQASPMVMITVPVELAMDVLDFLDREFYNRARIMPTHDNVVTALKFERTLNAHRRKQGALPAVTLGPKY